MILSDITHLIAICILLSSLYLFFIIWVLNKSFTHIYFIFIFRFVIIILIFLNIKFFFFLFVLFVFGFLIFFAFLFNNFLRAYWVIKISHLEIIFITIIVFRSSSLSLYYIHLLNLFIFIITLIIFTFFVRCVFHHLIEFFAIITLVLVNKYTLIVVHILCFLQVVLYLLEFLTWILNSISGFKHF